MSSRYNKCFLVVLRCAIVCISVRLTDVSALDRRVKRSNDYGYDFNVTPVERCPMNKSEHEKAEIRIGCNESQSYHCIPDKKHSTLIEFCYPRKQSLVQSGNCLELADTGYLNNVNCEKFTAGCPDTFYLSNEIYNSCLNVAFGCFTADKACLQEKFTRTHTVPVCACETENLRFRIFLGLFIVSIIGIFIYSILGILKRKKVTFCMENTTKAQTFVGDDETDPLGNQHQQDECLGLITDPEELESEHFADGETYSLRGQHQQDETHGLIPDPKELESEHFLEDLELLLLLRRHCLDGAFENFDYLLKTRILNEKDKKNSLMKILVSRDRNGSSLLHYAAKGGSKDILRTLLDESDKHEDEPELKLEVDDTNNFGHTILHIACKNSRYEICVFLLSDGNYASRLLKKKSERDWSAAHFTAVCGNIEIFDNLCRKGLEMNSMTCNKLNILDIACINKQTEFCRKIIKEVEGLDLNKSDDRGWTIVHIAVRVGNSEIFEHLINGHHIEIAKTKTSYSKKTILHICCEYGHYALGRMIVGNDNFKALLHDFDKKDWNALHFCAKGGNLDLFKLIETYFTPSTLWTGTDDGKTVLHICCIHKNVEICEYLCTKFKSDTRKINKKTKKGWTAAHYVAVEIQQNGTEEKLIDILNEVDKELLKAKTDDGYTVLTVACAHRNKKLVKYLVKNFSYLLDIEWDILSQVARDAGDEIIEKARIKRA
ncbi:uncharacterized protein LOC111107523 isoform X2 [Crassostrea virginica]